jgi:hypothetical protein
MSGAVELAVGVGVTVGGIGYIVRLNIHERGHWYGPTGERILRKLGVL